MIHEDKKGRKNVHLFIALWFGFFANVRLLPILLKMVANKRIIIIFTYTETLFHWIVLTWFLLFSMNCLALWLQCRKVRRHAGLVWVFCFFFYHDPNWLSLTSTACMYVRILYLKNAYAVPSTSVEGFKACLLQIVSYPSSTCLLKIIEK